MILNKKKPPAIVVKIYRTPKRNINKKVKI